MGHKKAPILIRMENINLAIDRDENKAYIEMTVSDGTNRSVMAQIDLDYFLDHLDEMYLRLAQAENEEKGNE